MKLNCILFYLVLLSFSSNAQTSDMFIGKWQFKDFYNSGVNDSAVINNSKKLYSKLNFTFYVDQHYISDFIGKDEGIWKYNAKTKRLSLIKKDGQEDFLNVISLTDDKLVLSFPDNKGFILEKLVTPDQ